MGGRLLANYLNLSGIYGLLFRGGNRIILTILLLISTIYHLLSLWLLALADRLGPRHS